MKIAIDISQIAYPGTGVANAVSNLVRNLISLDRKNQYILFGISLRKLESLYNFYHEVREIGSNVCAKFFPIPQTVGNFLWNRLHVPDIEMLIGQIDIFHSSDWIQPPTKAKKLTKVHDLTVYKYPEYSHPYIIQTQKRRLAWVKRECDIITVNSQATKKDLITILKIDPSKIVVTYPGIESEFKPQKEEEIIRMRQKYGLSDDYILSVSVMEPRKNLQRVIAAFQRFHHHPLIKARKRPVELVLVGKTGWGTQPAEMKSIRILGYVEQKDLPAVYAGALELVYPSLYEGFGFPVLEAMACGCPVITSGRGSLQEIAGDSALLVDPEMEDDIAIKMTQLCIDADLREKLINKGKENASKYTWEKTAKSVLAIYKNLIQTI